MNNIFYILAEERERYKKSFKSFLHDAIWCSNVLDGFHIDDLRIFEERMMKDDEFIARVAQTLLTMVDERVANYIKKEN